jgi:formamidopyrimidine-DNA glycosylase
VPDVETVRRGLEKSVVGRRIVAVEVGRARVVRRTSPEALIHGLQGVRVDSADRRGKYLLLGLDSGESAMIHLRMSGRILIAEAGAPRPPHTHVVAALDDGHELWFVDPRTFGEVVVYDPRRVDVEVPELARLGIDPLVDPFVLEDLRRIVRSTNRALKSLLLDQHLIAGIGNIYADEILHRARLRPSRLTSSLDGRAIRRLHQSIGDVLRAAIAAGGSTLRDNQYVDLTGIGGGFQDDHRVYARGGLRCITCGRGFIRTTLAGGRTTQHCPVCQR